MNPAEPPFPPTGPETELKPPRVDAAAPTDAPPDDALGEGPPPDIHLPSDDAVISRAFQISVLVIVMIALIVSVGIWLASRPLPDPPKILWKNEPPQGRKNTGLAIPMMVFADGTRTAGISFVHESGAVGEKLLPEAMGGGCAFLDYNNDGNPDILFVNSDYWPGPSPPIVSGPRWPSSATTARGPSPT